MSSSPNNPLPAVQDSLSDFEFMKLSERLKLCTWIIKVSYENSGEEFETYGTGFALKVDKTTLGDSVEESDIVLMTCWHYFPKTPHTIAVRSFGDNYFLKAQPLERKANWDTALLVVKGASCGNYAEFCDDGSISNCQTLLQIGHSDDMIWSVFVGRAAYPCMNYLGPLGPIRTCANFPRPDLTETPNYRIMGHTWNKPYFDAHEKKLPFERNLDPWIPIIQCNGFLCRKGCSGGPVFNIQGKVVGMLVGEFDGCQTAIHVTLLKKFVEDFKTKIQGFSEVNKNVKQHEGGSKDTLRGLKRKEGAM